MSDNINEFGNDLLAFTDSLSNMPADASLNDYLDLANGLNSQITKQYPSRRDFIINGGKFLLGLTGALSVPVIISGFSAIGTEAQDETHDSHDSESEHHEEEHHNPNHISNADVIGSSVVSGMFATLIASQFAIEGMGMSPATTFDMVSAWGVKMAMLAYDAREGNPNKDEQIASKHSFDHEKAELSNIVVGAALVAASELTSYINVSGARELIYDESTGEVEHDKIKHVLDEIFELQDDHTYQIGGIPVDRERMTAYLKLKHSDAEEVIKALGVAPQQEQMEAYIQNKTIENFQNLTFADVIENEEDLLLDYIDSVDTANTINYLLKTYQRYKSTKEELGNAEIDKEMLSNIVKGMEFSIANKLREMEMIGVVAAPFSLTFTTASLANKIIPDIATDLVALRIAQRLVQNEFDQEPQDITPEMLLELVKADVINSDLNSAFGLVNLAVATAANMNGAALMGDPPNIFFMISQGPTAWLKASAQGFVTSLGSSVALFETYITKTLGREYAGLPISQGLSAFNLVITNTVFRNSMEGVKASANTVVNKLPLNLRPSVNSKLGRLLQPNSNYESLSIDLGGFISNGDKKLKEAFYIKDNLGETVGQFTEHLGLALKPIKKLLGLSKSDTIDNIEDLTTSLHLNPAQVLQLNILKEGLNVSKASIDSILGSSDSDEEKVEALYNSLSGLIISNDNAELRASAENTLRNILRESVKNTHSHDGHQHYMSHNAKEVRDALFTQLWAVGSLQTLTKKLFGMDQEKPMSYDEFQFTSGALLTSIALMSSSADNVAAMLFGINVMTTAGQKYIDTKIAAIGNTEERERLVHVVELYRSKQLEGHDEEIVHILKDLDEAQAKHAFLTAVFAGSLLKFGNGANMSIERVENIIIETMEYINTSPEITELNLRSYIQEKGIQKLINVEKRPNELGESAKNIPAILSTLTEVVIGFLEIKANAARVEEYFARAA